MENIILNVEGMSCSHCESAVKKAVEALSGVKSVNVNLEHKTVEVTFDGVSLSADKIATAIEDQGYDVV